MRFQKRNHHSKRDAFISIRERMGLGKTDAVKSRQAVERYVGVVSSKVLRPV